MFTLLLPETTHSDAAALLNRLAAQGSTGRQAPEPPLQFRAGIAVYPNDGKTVHKLMQYAHNALHQEQQQEGQP
jgi:GGDEF domain-containing protein